MSLNQSEKYSEDDIYNAEEIGLIYDLTPDEINNFRGIKCDQGEIPHRRVVILFCTNMAGTDKRDLAVIGCETNPTSFSKVKETLPLYYTGNDKAWMTSDIFKTYIYQWDRELEEKGRKVLLLIDNSEVHRDILICPNVKIVFLSSESDSALRQGIIHNFKTNYRKGILELLNVRIQKNKTLNISILDAIIIMKNAWADVSTDNIRSCFYKTIFQNSLKLHESNFSMREWMKNKKLFFFSDEENLEDFVSVDDNIASSAVPV